MPEDGNDEEVVATLASMPQDAANSREHHGDSHVQDEPIGDPRGHDGNLS